MASSASGSELKAWGNRAGFMERGGASRGRGKSCAAVMESASGSWWKGEESELPRRSESGGSGQEGASSSEISDRTSSSEMVSRAGAREEREEEEKERGNMKIDCGGEVYTHRHTYAHARTHTHMPGAGACNIGKKAERTTNPKKERMSVVNHRERRGKRGEKHSISQ